MLLVWGDYITDECVGVGHCRRSMLSVVGLGDVFAIDVCNDVVHCGKGRRIHHQCGYRFCSLFCVNA